MGRAPGLCQQRLAVHVEDAARDGLEAWGPQYIQPRASTQSIHAVLIKDFLFLLRLLSVYCFTNYYRIGILKTYERNAREIALRATLLPWTSVEC